MQGKEILKRKFNAYYSIRRVTANTALRSSYYFGTSAKFWLGLQDDYDFEEETRVKKSELENIKKYENDAA